VATSIGAYATTTLLKAMIGTTDSDDDPVLTQICDRVNAYIEFATKRVLAPIASATYLVDGTGLTHLYFSPGIRAITELKIGDFTGDTLDTIASGDYFLRPLAQDRVPGWPAMYVELSDRPAGLHRVFHKGRQTVSLTATTGWPAIPDEITELALAVAQRAWNNKAAGLQDQPAFDEHGRPVIARFISGRDKETLKAYTVKQPAVQG
jgi:hypothetical protein